MIWGPVTVIHIYQLDKLDWHEKHRYNHQKLWNLKIPIFWPKMTDFSKSPSCQYHGILHMIRLSTSIIIQDDAPNPSPNPSMCDGHIGHQLNFFLFILCTLLFHFIYILTHLFRYLVYQIFTLLLPSFIIMLLFY